jgi:hypothetical protein
MLDNCTVWEYRQGVRNKRKGARRDPQCLSTGSSQRRAASTGGGAAAARSAATWKASAGTGI